MSDDFLRLVSQANPATRQYQPANGYPPSSASTAGPYSDRSPQLMDPFFDDEDDNVPDSAFGRPAPMQSQESGLPLARSAAPPAGVGASGSSSGLPQGWTFDDDDFQPGNNQSFPGPSKPLPPSKGARSSRSWKLKKWKWPWEKEQVLTGERVVALNNSDANSEFSSNFVSTSKYNFATFIPKFLYGNSIRSKSSPHSGKLIIFYRTIFEICQFILPLHGFHPTNSWSLPYPTVYHNCTFSCCSDGLGIQGAARGLGEYQWMELFPLVFL